MWEDNLLITSYSKDYSGGKFRGKIRTKIRLKSGHSFKDLTNTVTIIA